MTTRRTGINFSKAKGLGLKLPLFHNFIAWIERLITELRRRHVFKIAAGYAVVAFVTIQLADLTYGPLDFPPWAYQATVFAVLGMAPVVLILAWIYDITSEGIRRTEPIEESATATAERAAVAPAVYSPRSVAILPFTNLTTELENEYFSDGITEDIIARASRIRDLKVISRTSVMQYKGTKKTLREIGRELGVAAILEGSVRRTGDRVRIVAQLMDARTDSHRWAETYDRTLPDIFTIQTDVANQIAAALQAELSPKERELVSHQPTENLEAYDLYLRARYEWSRRTGAALERSVEMLKQALELDSHFALAWAGLADTYVTLGVYGARAPSDVMPQARDAAERALRIDPTLVEALTALASYHAVYQRDFRSAHRAFDAAIEMGPQYATAPQWLAMNVLVPQGHFEQAEGWMARASELDPISPVIIMSLAVLAYYKRDYGLADEICGDLLSMHPQFSVAHYFRGLALEQMDKMDQAIESLKKSVALSVWSTETMAALAHAYAIAGRSDEARATIARLADEATTRYVSPSYVAQAYVGLGDYDRAFELLDQAREIRSADLIWIGVRPTFDPVRNDPRFRKLLDTVGVGGAHT